MSSKRLLSMVVLLFVLLSLTPLAGAAAAPDTPLAGTLWGQVIDAGGQPVATAQVCVEGTTWCGWTTAQGTFGIANLSAGWYSVAANRPGYSVDRHPIQIQNGVIAWSTFRIVPVGTLWGRVMNSSGTVMPSVTVTIEGTSASVLSTSQGTFGFNNIAAGWYAIVATMPGYVGDRRIVQILPSQIAWLDLVITDANSGAIWGMVKNPANGAGVGGAQVVAGGRTTSTTGNGSFGVSGVAPGWYRVTAGLAGYVQAAPQSVQVVAGTPGWADLRLWPVGMPNDPGYYSSQWGMGRVNMPDAWNYSRGTSVIIAVVDTGVDLTHPDLQGHLVSGYNAINPGASPQDDHGHGSHVAGIAAAVTNNSIGVVGAGWDSKIMPVKVLNSQGSGYNSTITSGILFAAQYGARVINMSLGGPYPSSTMQDAIVYARNLGVVVVAAAGNCQPTCGTVNYPAAYAGVLGVAASDETDNDAWFSSCGSWVDVMAPGTNIYSTLWPHTYGYEDGTSMATPLVSGVVALMRARNPDMAPDTVQAVLQSTSSHGGTRYDDCEGYGRIDASAAVRNSSAVSEQEKKNVTASPAPQMKADLSALKAYQATRPAALAKSKNLESAALPAPEVRPGVVLVKLKQEVASAAASRAFFAQKDYQVLGVIAPLDVYQVQVPVGQESAAAAQLQADPKVKYAEPDYLVTLDDPQ